VKKKKKEVDIKLDTQRLSAVKDELEYATNWRRLYIDLYTRIKWLNAYAKINLIAIFK
jgi:hypothetical protein